MLGFGCVVYLSKGNHMGHRGFVSKERKGIAKGRLCPCGYVCIVCGILKLNV